MDNQTYETWKLAIITLIIRERTVRGNVWKISEVNCVIDDDFLENFNDGDTPEDAWLGELESICDSQ